MDIDLTQLLWAFGTTVSICFLILATEPIHRFYSSDANAGPQKVHVHTVPRIGGVGLLCGLIIAGLTGQSVYQNLLTYSVVVLLPVFIFGLAEDLTKNVSPRLRLISSLVAGAAFIFIFDTHLTKTGFEVSDQLLAFPFLAILLIVLAISSLINAMNIVDGLNGLSIGSSLAMMLSVAVVAFKVGDWEVVQFALTVSICLIGVALFNFPIGRMFMGDSGAYLMGGIVAFSVILISERNDDVSPFFGLLVIAYPFYELMRTMLRRIRATDVNVMAPDLEHLHSLIFTNLQSRGIVMARANVQASCRVLCLPLLCAIWSASFSDQTFILILGICGMIALYEGLFRRYSAN